jgi:glutaredoxin
MITIYGTSICKWCERAKELATQYSLEWEFRNVEHEHFYEELKELQPSFKTVPQIFWDGRYIGGYEKLGFEIENTMGGYGDGKI